MDDRLNKWVHVTGEGCTPLLAFTYDDPTAGPSAKGTVARLPLEPEHAKRAIEEPETTLRLSGWKNRLNVRTVSEAEARDLGLPPEPPWFMHFRRYPPWREDPLLTGKFHPEYPDDIQIFVHAGNPRFSGKRPELVWVRIQESLRQSYRGILLNEPQQLEALRQGDSVQFMAVQSSPHPFMANDAYLEDRKGWVVSPCDKCGFTEMFQPPSERAAAFMRENNIPEENTPIMLSTFCPLCGGCQILGKVGTEAEQKVREFNPCGKKKWWRFWKK